MKRMFKLGLTVALAVALLASLTMSSAATMTTQQWNDLIKAAQREGKVVVYSVTSRITTAAANFEKKYGIKVESHRLSETEIIERVYQEGKAKVNAVDLVILEDYPSMKELLIDTGYLVNYIPPTALKDVPKELQNPLVFAHVSRVIGYNTEKYKTSPIESIWDLTTPQWKGKVMIRDLAITGEHQNAFTEIVRRSPEIAAEYERRFGKKLVLREANAGLEFLRCLAENDIILMTSDTLIAEAVGKKGQADPPIGFFYVFSKHRDADTKNLAIAAATNVKPFAGYYYSQYVQLSGKPKNPNAAKLFAEYIMTPEGFEPWSSDLGFYASSTAVKPYPDDQPWSWWKQRLWGYDYDFAIKNRGIVLDTWFKSIAR